MKSFRIVCLAALAFAGSWFLTACDKDDATPPLLTMNGEEIMTIYLNAPFNDPGVTANDNEDGNITVTSDVSSTNPDVNKVGTYYINYAVTDAAGNKSEMRRTVLVKNQAETLSDAYSVTATCTTSTDTSTSVFTDGIIISTTVNKRITFTQFGRYTNAAGKLSADIDFITSSVTIVPTSFVCGTNPTNRTFIDGSGGAISFNGNTIIINTIEMTATDTANCTYTYFRQ